MTMSALQNDISGPQSCADQPLSGVDGRKRRLPLVIQALQNAADELRGRGIVHAGVFGSVSRGDDGPESDVDIVVEIDVDRVGHVLRMVSLITRIEELVQAEFPGKAVDVADREMLKPRIREAVEREATYAF